MFKKDSRIHNGILIITVIGAALVGVLLLLRSRNIDPIYTQTLTGPGVTIPVSVANTEPERNQGLSGTQALPANCGKLFVFQTSGLPGFWMKDMNYGLDFVWLDSNLKIVDLTPNVAASTYPEIFYPTQPILYVLEVNEGFIKNHQLHIGEQFTLK